MFSLTLRNLTQAEKVFIALWSLSSLGYLVLFFVLGFMSGMIVFMPCAGIFAIIAYGVIIGVVQDYHLQKRLNWEIKHWQRWTIIGVSLGLMVSVFCAFALFFYRFSFWHTIPSFLYDYLERDSLVYLSAFFLFRLIVAAFQTLALRASIEVRGRWLWSNLVSVLIIALFAEMGQVFDAIDAPSSPSLLAIPLVALGFLLSASINAVVLVIFSHETNHLPQNTPFLFDWQYEKP